nr:MAG TPA: hypothetical protein [Caudoviricetes sp.]
MLTTLSYSLVLYAALRYRRIDSYRVASILTARSKATHQRNPRQRQQVWLH